jgi:hypothetical protein
VTAAKKGSGAKRFWIGFGAGRAVLLFDATFTDASGRNIAAFPNETELATAAATRSIVQLEEFMLNGGTFPSHEKTQRPRSGPGGGS